MIVIGNLNIFSEKEKEKRKCSRDITIACTASFSAPEHESQPLASMAATAQLVYTKQLLTLLSVLVAEREEIESEILKKREKSTI